MARDSHPRERQARALQRKRGKRPPYDRVLIVCEGSKTEPLYFDDIRIENRVPSAHVSVMPSRYGTQPLQVVKFACDKFQESRTFEWVFAVFDRDDHETYQDALRAATRLDNTLRNTEKKKVRFIAVPSVPCFELWVLLHFTDIQEYFHRDEIVARLCKHIANYQKGTGGVYGLTVKHLPLATGRAQRLQQLHSPHSGNQPFTNVDVVVTLLRGIRRTP